MTNFHSPCLEQRPDLVEWLRPRDGNGRWGVFGMRLPPCPHRGAVIYATLEPCGQDQRSLETFACAKHGEADSERCAATCRFAPWASNPAAEAAFEASRAKAMEQYEWVRPRGKDGRNGVRAWKVPPCVFRGPVTFATLRGCCGGQRVEEEYWCAKTGADVLAMSCLRCPLREESVLASPKARIVETKPDGNGETTYPRSSTLMGSERGPAVAVPSAPMSGDKRLPSSFVVSAVLPARDEGADVAATAASFLAAGVDEVIVVDDASRDGSCGKKGFSDLGLRVLGAEGAAVPKPQDPKPQNPAVRVIRNKTPLGCALCRNIGGRAATGHVILFADAHMRAESSLRDFALAAYQRGVILNAAVKPLDGEHDTTCYGARIVPDKDSPAYRMAHIVRRPDRGQRFAPILGLHGACYAIPRPLWGRLDGWVENQGWGYNEQALSMKAFFLGIAIESDAETVVRHRYRKQFPYSTSLRLTLLNRFITHRTLFDDRTWRRHWLPLFAKAWPDVAADWAKLDRSRRYWKMRDNFRKRKVRTDEEFFDKAVSK